MSIRRRVAFVIDEKISDDLKMYQIKNKMRSVNDILVILALKFLNGETTIPKSYNIKADVEKYLCKNSWCYNDES